MVGIRAITTIGIVLICSIAFSAPPAREDMFGVPPGVGEEGGSVLGLLIWVGIALVLYAVGIPALFLGIAYKFQNRKRVGNDYYRRCFSIAKENVWVFVFMAPCASVMVLIPLSIINLPLWAVGIDRPSWLFVSIPIGVVLAAFQVIQDTEFGST